MAEFAKVFRIEMSGGKDVETDIVSMKKQMSSLGAEITKTKKALSGLLTGKNDSSAVTDLKSKIADLEGQVVSLNEKRNDLNNTAQKEAQTNTQLSNSTKEQTGEYLKLNQQYKEAKINAQNLAAQYGVESDQAIQAAKSANDLKLKIQEINNLVKSGGVQPTSEAVVVPIAQSVGTAPTENTNLQKAKEKLAATTTDEAAEIAKLNVQQQINNKANKDAAIEALGLKDAYQILNEQYTVASKNAKNIGVTQGETSDAFKAASADAKVLGDRLKAIDNAVGQNQRNVGNYAASFSILEKTLVETQNKINNLKQAPRDAAGGQIVGPRGVPDSGARAAQSDDLQQLTKQETALQQVLSTTSRGFSSLTQELKVNERSLQTLRSVGLQESEVFKTLQTQVDSSRRSFNEFAAQQKILSSQAPAITALTSVAKGLAGAYGITASTAIIFGDQEGKINEKVQVLVASMTLLQGLQEAHALLMEKDAIATAIASAAQKVYAFVVGESTGAMAAFKVALAGTGIGLFIIALGYLINNWDKLFKVTDPVIKQFDTMPGVSNVARNALKAYGKTAEDITKGILKDFHDQIKAINDQLGITPTTSDLAKIHIQALSNTVGKLTEENVKLAQKAKNPFDNESAFIFSQNAKEIGKLKDQIGALNVVVGEAAGKEAFLNQALLNTARANNLIQLFKDQQGANNRILALQATSYKDRLALTNQNFALEKLIIERAHQNELREAKDDQDKRFAADEKAKSALLNAEGDFQATRDNIVKQYAQRDEKAQSDILQRSLQARIEGNKKIAANEIVKYKDQLSASKKAYQEELALSKEQQRHDLTEEGLTATEKRNIRDKYRTADTLAHQDYILRNQDIDKKEFERQNKELRSNLEERIAIIKENNAKTQNDPTISGIDKAQAQIDSDNEILAAEQTYYGNLLKLNSNFNKEALSQIRIALSAQRKVIDANRKLLFDGQVKDIADASGKLSDEFKTRLAQATTTVLTSELSPRQQANALLKLQDDAEDALLANQVAALKRDVDAKKKALADKLISEKEYQDAVAAYQTAATVALQKNIDKQTSLLQRFKNALKDFGADFKESVLGIKTYSKDAAGDQQKVNDAIKEGLGGVKTAITTTYQTYFKAQSDAIDKNKQAALDFEEREKNRMLALAQSDEERATIERKSDQERAKIEKKAAEEKKKLALKQATIEFAVAAIKTFATYGFPLGLIALAGLTAAYIAQRAAINQQQFAGGGKVQPEKINNGLINSHANIPAQSNGDNILATVKTGEVILNKRQQQAIGGAQIFKRIGVPGFASGGSTGSLGSKQVAPSFSASEFLNGSSSSNLNSVDQLAEMRNMLMQTMQAVYATDQKTVVLNPHQVTKAQKSRQKDVSVGTL